MDNMEGLSQQQIMVIQNILSIQDYYRLKDHRKLISIILDRKQSQQLFGQKKIMISNVFEKNYQGINQETKINVFSQKYTYENLVQKFKNPRSFKNNILTSILRKKMEKQTIISHNTRKSLWMLASGALFSMKNNKGLYQGLINYPDYTKFYEKYILLDLPRTVKKSQSTQEDIKALHNLLLAFSRRNPYIGYCQGLNFIAYFILTMQFKQQQAFWILSQVTQTIIPMDYYTNMMGVACDQQIFLQILRVVKPQIMKKFDEVGLDGSVLCIQWFVCLFTSSLPFNLVKIVWDRLFVEGTQAFIKTGIIILSHFQKQILQTKQFYEIIMIVEQGAKNLQISQQKFNKQFQKYYINTQGLKIARDLYRQFHVKQKLKQKLSNSSTMAKWKKIEQNECKTSSPICIASINQSRRNKFQYQVWTYRQQNFPKIIHDYMDNVEKKQVNLKSTINLDRSTLKGMKKVQYGDFVIGRMQHVCKNSKIIEERNFKKQKQNIKYLNLILQEQEQNQRKNQKKNQNIQKILRLSGINLQDELTPDNKQNLADVDSINKSGFQKSQTIQFYSQFVSNNKEIAQMLAGKK